MQELDKVSLDILTQVRGDPSLSQSELAKRVGVSRETCRKRLQLLVEIGAIVSSKRVAVSTQPSQRLTKYLLIKLAGKAYRNHEVEKAFAESGIVSSFSLVTGKYTYMACLQDGDDMARFSIFIRKILEIDGVEDTETLVVLP